jgi:5-methylcytosine-specific restriction endonuclease McrA
MAEIDDSIDTLQQTREMPCAACGAKPPSDPDHIRTRGAGGTDDLWNLMPLCRKCHTLKHAQGLNGLKDKHPRVKAVLIEKGWHYDHVFKKWLNQKI